jgi:hypothetical protein
MPQWGWNHAAAFPFMALDRAQETGPAWRLGIIGVLDREKIQGHATQEEGQPDPRSHREEGERSMAQQSLAIDRTARTTDANFIWVTG